jgi:hypothetical protein
MTDNFNPIIWAAFVSVPWVFIALYAYERGKGEYLKLKLDFINGSVLLTDARQEIENLRHDNARHMKIASDLMTESGGGGGGVVSVTVGTGGGGGFGSTFTTPKKTKKAKRK